MAKKKFKREHFERKHDKCPICKRRFYSDTCPHDFWSAHDAFERKENRREMEFYK